MFTVMDLLSWGAIVILSASYWIQVWHIHKHKEVRDLNIWTWVGLSIGFSIMSIKAIDEGTYIFLVKQIATLVPSLIVVLQIWWHRRDTWED